MTQPKSDDVVLLPCPFCGGEPTLHRWEEEFYAPGAQEACQLPHVFVQCVACEGGHPPTHAEAEAIAAWNTRAALQSKDGEAGR